MTKNALEILRILNIFIIHVYIINVLRKPSLHYLYFMI